MTVRQTQWGCFLKQLPVPICGLTLGLGALGNMLLAYSGFLYWLYGFLAAVLWGMLIVKFIIYRQEFLEELKNPVAFSVFEAFFMTLLQLALYMEPYFHQLAYGLWLLANVGHIVLVICFSWRFLRQFHLSTVYTTWNVLYGGNVLAAVISPVFDAQLAGQWIFWIGAVLFLPWYPISAWRYWKLPVPEPVLPTLCILAAPFNLMLAGYLSVMQQPQLWLVLLLAIIGQSMYIFVLIQLPKLLKLPFYPSYGALTFPFVISAVAMKKLLLFLTAEGIGYPSMLSTVVLIEEVIAVVMVTYALIRYLLYLGQIYQRGKSGCGA